MGPLLLLIRRPGPGPMPMPTPRPRPYVQPSPAGWASTAARSGPDPDFATAARSAGEGGD